MTASGGDAQIVEKKEEIDRLTLLNYLCFNFGCDWGSALDPEEGNQVEELSGGRGQREAGS